MVEGPKEPEDHHTNEDEFIVFLREQLEVPSKSAWKKAVTAGAVLERRKAVVNAIEKLEALGWEKPGGGFKVSDGA